FALSVPSLPPRSTLFPYTTLFRSARTAAGTDSVVDCASRRRAPCFGPCPHPLVSGVSAARCLFPTSPNSRATRGRARSCPSAGRSEEHTSELQSRENLVCRLLLEK